MQAASGERVWGSGAMDGQWARQGQPKEVVGKSSSYTYKFVHCTTLAYPTIVKGGSDNNNNNNNSSAL